MMSGKSSFHRWLAPTWGTRVRLHKFLKRGLPSEGLCVIHYIPDNDAAPFLDVVDILRCQLSKVLEADLRNDLWEMASMKNTINSDASTYI